MHSDTRKLLSIVICTYNRMDMLLHVLKSLLTQHEKTDLFNIIVVDNNSSDNTKELVKEYQVQMRNLEYIFENTQGLSHARNRGCNESQSLYIAYLDDDAKAPPEYVSRCLSIIRNYEPDIFGGPILPFFTDKKPSWFRDEYEIRQYASKTGFSNDCQISGSNFVIKRSILIDLGLFDTDLGMKGEINAYGEERKILEEYRRIWKKASQKVYYDLDLYVFHHVPAYKMNLFYMIKRKYAGGKTVLRILKEQKTKTNILISLLGLPVKLFVDIYKEIKLSGIIHADYIKILLNQAMRLGSFIALVKFKIKNDRSFTACLNRDEL